jgi:N utilization substance protein B
MARKRHLSRIAVMQVLFEREQRRVDEEKSLQRNIDELGGGADMDLAHALLEGVIALQEELEGTIEKDAPDWSLERMDPIARSVLLVGTYELLHGDAPPAVVMNEAIEIAKEYGSEESGKFVNGVLNAIAQRQ